MALGSGTSSPLGTSRRRLTLGLVLTLTLRLGYVLGIPNAIPRWRDGLSYDNIARNVVAGVGYWDTTGEWPGEPSYASPSAPTARWMPGYPLFIAAGVYQVFGDSYRAVYVAQAILGVAIAALVYLIARHTVGASAGALAVYLYALDPFSIFLCGRFQTEQLFTLLVAASLYCFLRLGEDATRRPQLALAFGLLAGAAVLTRSMAGLMFAGLCLAALLGWDEGFARTRFDRRVFALAIASIASLYAVTHRTEWRRAAPIYIVLLTFALGYSLVAALTRFRIPLNPLLEILATGGMLVILRRFRPGGFSSERQRLSTTLSSVDPR